MIIKAKLNIMFIGFFHSSIVKSVYLSLTLIFEKEVQI
jgi:hypothetical protein